ncbi:unnamed protein product [marine sediment metagenome]|uniref:Uncharacterized protein n=1 Tax=marine sediment metagenome TaxID=412755 RepID=X1SQK7_9ZZZZ
MVVENAPGPAAEETGEKGEYGLHIRLAREMQPVLKDAADLAFKMGDVPKADLVNLINLFIVWGLSIQKKKWLDRMGYR